MSFSSVLDAVGSLHNVQVGQPTNLRLLLQRIAESARQMTSADLVAVYAVNPVTTSTPEQRKFLRPPAISGEFLSEQEEYYIKTPRPNGLTEDVLREGSLFVEDTNAADGRASTFTREEGIRSFAALALKPTPNDRPLGVVYVDFRSEHVFTAREKADLLKFSEVAAHILKSTWYLRRYLEVIRIGQDINQDLSDVETLFEKLCTHLPGIVNTSHGFLLAVNKPETGLLDLYIWERGRARTRLNDPYEGGCKWVIENRQPLLIQDLSKENARLVEEDVELVDVPDGENDRSSEIQERSLVFVPIFLRSDVPVGVLSVQHRQPGIYDAEDQRLLEALASHLALAINNIRLFAGLRELNRTGQVLTSRLDSLALLDEVVKQIHQVTRADILILYPYDQALQRFDLPPKEIGTLRSVSRPEHKFPRADDIASLTVAKRAAVFARTSSGLYELLGGDPNARKGNFEVREEIASTAAVPLRVGDEAVGAIFVNYRHRQRFDAPQKQLIESLAAFAAIAIKNARTYESLASQRIRELELLQQIDKRIGSLLDLEELLNEILVLTGEHIQADEASILLYEPAANVLYTAAAIGRNREHSLSQVISLTNGVGIARLAYEEKRTILVEDLSGDQHYLPHHLAVAEDIRSELDVPILDGNTVVGVINVESTRPHAFPKSIQDFLVTLAGQAALAIRNANAYEREKRAVDERQALIDIGAEIAAQLDLEKVFNLVLDKALEVTGCDAGNLMLYDPLRNDLWMAAQRGVVEDKVGSRQQLNEGVVGWVATHPEPLNIDVTKPPWNHRFLPFIPGTCAELAVPLLEGDRLRGVLNIESRTAGLFPDHDVRLLEAMAKMAVIALQNAERYAAAAEGKERLEALNEVDKVIIALADNPDAVMQAIVQNSLLLTKAQLGDLSLVDEGKIRTRYFAEKLEGGKTMPGGKLVGASAEEMPYGIIRHVLDTGKPYHTMTDAQNDPYYVGRQDIHSELAVPLLTEQNVLLGVLNLEGVESHAFDEDDAEIIELLAGQAVIAYTLAQSYVNVLTERRRFAALHETAELCAQVTTLEDVKRVYQAVGDKLAELTAAEIVIRRLDQENQELVREYCVHWRNALPPERISLYQGVAGQVAREKQPIVIDDTDNPPEGVSSDFVSTDTRSAIVTPIKFEDHYYGNLSLTEARPHAFVEADRLLLQGMARQLALNLHRIEETAARNLAEQRASSAEAMSSMGQSAFELAHRLGNDLGLVGAYIESIEDEFSKLGVSYPSVDAELAKIRRDVQLVLSLSSELKETFQDDRHGGQPLKPVAIPAQVLLEEAASSLPALPSAVSVTLEPVAPGILPVYADHRMVADVLRNLFTNAVEAMPKGGTITLRANEIGSFVAIEVTDTGVGIAKEKLSRIFDLFFTTKESSFGFGLWSARRNALANGGDLTVASEPGQGTTFTLTLPRGVV